MIKIIVGIILLAFNLYPQSIKYSCSVNDDIIASILKTESHKDRLIGYPYLISFNNSIDKKIIKKTSIKNFLLDNRTIDCKNKKICVQITKILLQVGINNLDLGAFQINYKFHKHKIADYFTFSDSYYIACNYVENNVKKYGKNWYAVAGYHSLSLKENLVYQKVLKQNYIKILKYQKH